ncbi:unnamed protein product [Prorocentrum cordatum]|uniref:Protein kinase domain-containing protein n=1 Tax=Prorocentrum cordatum TaxID=2364126 RepID=A0ABN9X9X1_9DINO|nr:unnamed protein product [Polarella glacialis]
MEAPPAEGRKSLTWCGPCACRRRERFENGIDRFTLRFADPMKEEGFARIHRARLSQNMSYAIGTVATVGLISVIAHRFWDDSQYPTEEAQELSKWQMLIITVSILSLIFALGIGKLLADSNIASTIGLEILAVSAGSCFMVLLVTIPKHYIARVFGHADTEAVWGVNLGPTDGSLVLYIDLVVTAVHWLLPIRWIVLAPLEVIAILAYTVPALVLGSPAMNMVPFNVIGLLALTLFAAFGKRAFERQERALFAGFLSEKQMRFQAEFQLSKVDGGEVARTEDAGSERSGGLSRPGTTMSAAAFEGSLENASLDQIRAIGRREQWLMASGDDVQILPDKVLGSGGFGIVVCGLYHNTVVAVKAPRKDITANGAIGSSSREKKRHKDVLSEVRAGFLDRRLGGFGARGAQRRSKKSARTSES